MTEQLTSQEHKASADATLLYCTAQRKEQHNSNRLNHCVLG